MSEMSTPDQVVPGELAQWQQRAEIMKQAYQGAQAELGKLRAEVTGLQRENAALKAVLSAPGDALLAIPVPAQGPGDDPDPDDDGSGPWRDYGEDFDPADHPEISPLSMLGQGGPLVEHPV